MPDPPVVRTVSVNARTAAWRRVPRRHAGDRQAVTGIRRRSREAARRRRWLRCFRLSPARRATAGGRLSKLGDFAELIKNIEVRGMRPGRRVGGPRRMRASRDGRTPASCRPFRRRAGPRSLARRPLARRQPAVRRRRHLVVQAWQSALWRRRAREALAARRPDVVEEPVDPKRIRIDLRPVRRAMFDKLVADRAAFDALPLEEKQKVFAQVEQQMAGVAQGIEVLKKELATRAAPRRSTCARRTWSTP